MKKQVRVSLRVQFMLYIIVIHLGLIYLIFQWVYKDKLIFIASEVIVLLSVFVAIYLYNNFRKPIDFIAQGIESIRDKDFTTKFVPTGKSEIDQLIAVYNLMIDQLRQERTRQMEQQFFLEKLIDAAPIAILVFDFDDRISTVNPKAVEWLQLPAQALVGKTVQTISHPLANPLASLADAESRTIKVNGIETYRVQKSHFMDRGFRRSFIIVAEMTQAILETEKLAYGKVIRMMAHEVNNSIGAVNSILDVTKSVLQEEAQEDVSHAVQVAIERNDRLSLFMRRFADVVRLPVPQPVANDWVEVTRSMVQLMIPRAEAGGIRMTFATHVSGLIRLIDRVQIEQTLVNIIKNAIEACVAGQVVEVAVYADHVVIRDNGQPIDPVVAANLFNPFYSTRPEGQGIGLTLTREILLNHSLTFSLRTNAEGWTEFVINV
ncbi:sensor histidine kinase [Arsenicibacter rosenii]|uniref:histidine kinase n=1 Tax=Arsenicibacter rosenii TaxID=1750698 RepID=A0A1S2VFI1_9BACT|nr:ATP-binding protein [Arsenicibacter rosenii]OIN57469.1 histidine kinase [Arsenicibacter rosenii]